jgi:hypothetical protein
MTLSQQYLSVFASACLVADSLRYLVFAVQIGLLDQEFIDQCLMIDQGCLQDGYHVEIGYTIPECMW